MLVTGTISKRTTFEIRNFLDISPRQRSLVDAVTSKEVAFLDISTDHWHFKFAELVRVLASLSATDSTGELRRTCQRKLVVELKDVILSICQVLGLINGRLGIVAFTGESSSGVFSHGIRYLSFLVLDI